MNTHAQKNRQLGQGMTEYMTVLADSWAASGPGMIESKIKNDGFNPLGPFPYKPLEVLGGNPVVGLALTFFEYGAPPPDIGRVEPDRVHANRLK